MKLLVISVILIMGIVYFSSLARQNPALQTTDIQSNNNSNEVNIMSERYMFSPMLVRLKKDISTKIILTTNDVPHGLISKELNLNLSAYPGIPAEAIITPHLTGEFTIDCSVYCGIDHSKMKMTFIVVD